MADTNFSAVVQDLDHVIWAGASWAANVVGFVSSSGRPPTYAATGQPITQHFSGVTDATGLLTVTLAGNNIIIPPNTQWEFTIQPTGNVPPSKVLITVTGASFDGSAAIQEQITPISQSGIPQGIPQTRVLPAANQAAAIAESQTNPNNIYYWAE